MPSEDPMPSEAPSIDEAPPIGDEAPPSFDEATPAREEGFAVRARRYAALAVAHRASNAVGGVLLTLEADALRLELVDVRAHASGFATSGPSGRVAFEVPYGAVRGLLREGRVLLLSLDPAVVAPFHRFALTRFRLEEALVLGRAARLRSILRTVSWALPALGALATMAWMSRSGAALEECLAFGGLAATALALALRWWAAFALWGGPTSDRLRDEFEARLAARLGLRFAAPREHLPAPSTEVVEEALATVSRPRSLAPVLLLALSGVVGAAVLFERFAVAPVVRLPVPDATRGLFDRVPRLLEASRAAVTPTHPECRCERADSPLWSRPPPHLAFVVSVRRGELASPWLAPDTLVTLPQGGRERVEFEIAVVNDSAEPILGIDLLLAVWRRKGSERRNVIERSFSLDHELAPGKSVTWRVRARGNALRLTRRGMSATKANRYAPADAFAKLAENGSSAVRLHAATMLAYLGDPRAEGIARGLRALAPSEEEVRKALLATAAPYVACGANGDEACVVNRTDELARAVLLRDAVGKTEEVVDLFFPARGLRVPFPESVGPLAVVPRGPSDLPPR